MACRKTHYRNARGFTLIEVMIAMTILAFIALGVYQNTTQSFQLREKIEQDGDFYNSIRVALDIIGRDISHIFSPQALALPGELGKPTKPNPQNPNPAQLKPANAFWGAEINTFGVRPARLQGEESKLSFVINSHMRLFKDAAESDFAKITYSIEDDPLSPRGSPGKILTKTEDPAAFEEYEKKETAVKYTILTGVKSIKFEFIDGEKDTAFSKWDTASIEHQGVFPAVIKLTVEVFNPKAESTFTVIQEYRAELPL